jgi:hypothetical protein
VGCSVRRHFTWWLRLFKNKGVFFGGFGATPKLATLGKELKVGGEGFLDWTKMKLKIKLNCLDVQRRWRGGLCGQNPDVPRLWGRLRVDLRGAGFLPGKGFA